MDVNAPAPAYTTNTGLLASIFVHLHLPLPLRSFFCQPTLHRIHDYFLLQTLSPTFGHKIY